ncbi:hypothetical protein ACRRTK_010191 [Alexandromys fortis]
MRLLPTVKHSISLCGSLHQEKQKPEVNPQRTDNLQNKSQEATCLLSSPEEQMPEISRMAANWMPLHPYLPLRVSPLTLSLPLSPHAFRK